MKSGLQPFIIFISFIIFYLTVFLDPLPYLKFLNYAIIDLSMYIHVMY
ncbi:hypothetical protein SCIP_0255 [Scardovia inopinata JCM 12537]|nr:hypothetical protein SCIP_0255 [Scardovia inopinata JCM 12537]